MVVDLSLLSELDVFLTNRQQCFLSFQICNFLFYWWLTQNGGCLQDVIRYHYVMLLTSIDSLLAYEIPANFMIMALISAECAFLRHARSYKTPKKSNQNRVRHQKSWTLLSDAQKKITSQTRLGHYGWMQKALIWNNWEVRHLRQKSADSLWFVAKL